MNDSEYQFQMWDSIWNRIYYQIHSQINTISPTDTLHKQIADEFYIKIRNLVWQPTSALVYTQVKLQIYHELRKIEWIQSE